MFLVKKFLWLQNHFLGNRFEPKIFIQHFWDENLLWLQNHFPENRFQPNIFVENFLGINFYGCKIISSAIGLNQKFSSKIFIVAKSFLGNRFEPKISSKFFGQQFLCLQYHLFGNRFEPKIFIKVFWSKMFCLQNYYIRNRLEPKIFIINSLVELEIICSGRVLNQKLL